MKPKALLDTLIIATCAVLVLFIGIIWRRSLEPSPEANIHQSVPMPAAAAQTADPEYAFIKNIRAVGTAERGGAWSMAFLSNTWSMCTVELHTPDRERLALSKDHATAKHVGEGEFTWRWDIPNDVASGRWTVRTMCGTTNNIATTDTMVEIK